MRSIATATLAALSVVGVGCTSESAIPNVPGPDEPRTVVLRLPNCDLSVPPIVDWKDWQGRAVFEAADPAHLCRALQLLHDRMAARPIRFDTGEQPLDAEPVEWSRIARLFIETVPPPPPPPPEAAGDASSKPAQRRVLLCADVLGRSHRYCVTFNKDGSDLYFLPGHL